MSFAAHGEIPSQTRSGHLAADLCVLGVNQGAAVSSRAVYKGKPSRKNRLNRTTPRRSNRHMKIKSALSLLAAASLALSSAAFAAGAKTYEVTGPVLEVNDSMIVVQKGKDRWEINRDANTKVTGDVKVGDKVHVTYTMSATDVEVKAGKGAKKERRSSEACADAIN